MRSRLQIIITIILTIINLPTAGAESQPPAELNRLKYFEGTWRCQQPADNSDPSGEFTWNVEKGLNDFWYLGNAEQPVSDGQPINSREFLGYNTASE